MHSVQDGRGLRKFRRLAVRGAADSQTGDGVRPIRTEHETHAEFRRTGDYVAQRAGRGHVVTDNKAGDALLLTVSAVSSRPAPNVESPALIAVELRVQPAAIAQYPAGALCTELWKRIGETSSGDLPASRTNNR